MNDVKMSWYTKQKWDEKAKQSQYQRNPFERSPCSGMEWSWLIVLIKVEQLNEYSFWELKNLLVFPNWIIQYHLGMGKLRQVWFGPEIHSWQTSWFLVLVVNDPPWQVFQIHYALLPVQLTICCSLNVKISCERNYLKINIEMKQLQWRISNKITAII